MSGFYIFATMLVGTLVWMVFYLRAKLRRCRWCMVPTVKVADLPEPEHDRLKRLILDEGMGFDPDSYEICLTCKRVFDERWFGQDWEMHDRWCVCGWQLKLPWDMDTHHLREAVSRLPQDVIRSLLQVYTREEVKALQGGYSDIAARTEKQREEHVLFVCESCHRAYMWIPLNGYQIFQCVSQKHDKYDREPKPPFQLLDLRGRSFSID